MAPERALKVLLTEAHFHAFRMRSHKNSGTCSGDAEFCTQGADL